MLNNISEDLKKIMLLGIGTIALTAEKAKEVVDDLVKKGELTMEQGKVLNEELRHNIKEKVMDSCGGKQPMQEQLKSMSKEELEALKAKIAEMEKDEVCNLDESDAQ